MKYREGAVIAALERADSFLADYGPELNENAADLTRAQQKLEEVLRSLMTHAVDQDSGDRGARGETAKQRQLRLDLREEWLKPIAAIALQHLRDTPELKALQLPNASTVGNGFIASARGMASAAAVHRDVLIAYGLPESCVEDLNRAVDQFAASVAERDSNRVRRIGATKGLEAETQEGRTVLVVLDGLVRRWAKGDEALLRMWEAARLIHRRPGPVSGSGDSTTSTAAPLTERPLAAA